MSGNSISCRRAALTRLGAVAAFLAAGGLLACGSDTTSPSPGGTGPGPALTITADTATNAATAPAGATVTLGVHLKNPDGTPATNVAVSWGVSVGDGTITNRSTTTDAAGATNTQFTLSKKSGTNTVNASVPSANVNINVTGLAGAIAALSKASADSQSFVGGSSTLLTVRALDAAGNAVPNVPITWSATGGVVNPKATATGTSGQASTAFTVGNTPATYTIIASGPGGLQVIFTVKGL